MNNKNLTFCFSRWYALFFCLILGYTGLGQSQPTSQQGTKAITFQGTLQFELGEPVISGVVTLLNADSSLAKATGSDSTGGYIFKNIAIGSYLLQATYLGWKSVIYPIVVSDTMSTRSVDLVLRPVSATLQEVVVKEKRPIFEILGDRVRLNVESNPVFSGGTAFDALARSPRVVADAVGKTISVDGKTGVILYQNGRQLYLPPDQIITYLQNLPANIVSRIEVLTSPSANYDAGTNGVILLYTKGINKEGITGEIAVAGGSGRYGKGNASATVSWRSANVQGSFLYAPTYRPTYFSWRSDQILTSANSNLVGFAHSDEFNRITNSSHLLRTSWDLKVARQLTVGTVVQLMHTNETDRPSSSIMYQMNQEGATLTKLDAETQLKQRINNLGVNVNIRKQFNRRQNTLSVDLDAARYTVGSESSATFWQLAPIVKLPETLKIYYPNEVAIHTAKLDYQSTMFGKGKFESGVKYSGIRMNNSPSIGTYSSYFTALTPLLEKSYQYQERTIAVYSNWTVASTHLSFQAGLRLEHTRYNGLSGNTTAIFRDYTNLFPSLNVQFTSTNKHQFSLSANRRITRPSFDQLNPAYLFFDPLTLYSGNPRLVPQVTTTVQGTYTLPQRTSLVVVYSHSRNRIAEVVYRFDSLSPTTLDYNLNFDCEKRLAATISIPTKISNGWQIQTMMTWANAQFYSSFNDSPFLNKQSTFTVRVNNSFKWKSWSANLNGTYRGLAVVGYMIYDPIWFVDMGFQRPLGSKSTIKLAATDVFHTLLINNHGSYLNTTIGFKHKYESQQFMLTYSCQFGSKKAKTVEQHSFGSETEQERLGTKRN